MHKSFLIYILLSAAITYLIRMLPLTLFRRKIKSRFVLSFLRYIPYAVLSAMTIPAIFHATSSPLSAALGLIAALLLSYLGKSLLTVALSSCLAVFLTELILTLL